jgi:hypothetical protein
MDITIHIEAERLTAALNLLAAAILGTPSSIQEGTQFRLVPAKVGEEIAGPVVLPKEAIAALNIPVPAPISNIPTPAPAPTVTLEQVRAKMAEKSRAGRKDDVTALLKTFGATALSGIDPSRYAELLAAVEAI